MNYGYKRVVQLSFKNANVRIREPLKEQGFGVLT